MAPETTLSVIVPVYNEQHLVEASLDRLRILNDSSLLSRVRIIVVDDCSSDETPLILDRYRRSIPASSPSSKLQWEFLRHEKNQGKGAAVRTGLARADTELSVIHDADLEYHPKDLLKMIPLFIEEGADAVFGSRFLAGEFKRALLFRHELGNKLLTLLCDLVCDLNLTDMETCYKMVRTSLLRSIPIESRDFRIEPELTIKLAKRGARIYEVPIRYSGRTYQEGKKIGWKDGVRALGAILRFAVSDNIYHRDEYGSHVLARLSRAAKFNRWMADTIREFCGSRVLEIGSGVGNLTRQLIPRIKYVASDVNPLYLQTLQVLSSDRPYMETTYCDVSDLASYPRLEEGYDTVICLNVIEHVEDDRASLRNIKSVLAEGGRAVILVPQGQWNFGTLDEVLGHKRRYSRETLRALARDCGLEVLQLIEFNRVGSLAWFLNGKILRRRHFGLLQIWALDLLTPLIRLTDGILPIAPLSLIAIMGHSRDQAGRAREAGDAELGMQATAGWSS